MPYFIFNYKRADFSIQNKKHISSLIFNNNYFAIILNSY